MSAHDTAHSGHQEHHEEPRSKTAFVASFWFVIILVGLFIAALNFINVMGHDEEGGHKGHATEATSGHEAAAGHETNTAPAGEHAEATHEEHAATTDTAAHHEEATHH